MCSLGGVAGTGGVTESVGSAFDVLVRLSWRWTAGELRPGPAAGALTLVVDEAPPLGTLACERASSEESDCESLRGMAGEER